MSTKNKSSSSGRWLKEHFDDKYVQEAQKKGYRSRAYFKLKEIHEKEKLINKGSLVVDLGAAPGGWSQFAAEVIGDSGAVIACDILPMDSMAGVHFLQGDFREECVLNALLEKIKNKPVDVVLSDMAPNFSGNNVSDQAKSMYLVELALDMCRQVLTRNGKFVVKVFQGADFDSYLKEVRKNFKTVKIRKPDSSRDRSREVYIVAIGFNPNV